MKIFSKTSRWSFVLVLAMSCSLSAQKKESQDAQPSCRDFVQQFYNWYVRQPTWERALKDKRFAASAELLRLLIEDAAAQAKVTGEIVGLDFDPILNSQDPAKRYVVGKITPNGSRYWVEVYRVEAGVKDKKPSVVPEVMMQAGRWIFVNFHYKNDPKYPENENLLSILKGLREARRKPPKAR